MIIFYNKKTFVIFGVVEGRIHEHPEKEMIKPSDVEQEDVGMFVVPFKPLFQNVEKEIKKFFLKDPATGEMEERVVDTIIEKVPAGLIPDVPFAELIVKFERKQEDIFKYKIKVDENNNVTGFEKNV